MSVQSHLTRAVLRVAAGVLAAAALASCGGGTYQVKTYQPVRIVSFGDESSLLLPDGSKYSINGVNSTTHVLDCTLSPLWIQRLASSYGMVYPECNPEVVAAPGAHSYATFGATVDDMVVQLNAFQASDSFTPGDLVTILIGVQDVLAVYSEANGNDNTALVLEMRARGLAVAKQVNTIIQSGAKVVLLTIPDMGDSPFGKTEADRGDFDRKKLLSDLSDAFNRSMRSNIVNDGSKIGLVLVDDYIHAATKIPSAYGFTSTTTSGCLDTSPLPSCTTDTIVADANGVALSTAYLWADPTHLGNAAQLFIGNQATSRAHSNPF